MATLAHNLDVRRQLVWDCWGTGVVVGWIGDQSHQQSCSDHNPDSTGKVHAIDVMVTGDRAQAVVNACLTDHGDLEYVIYNRTIWSDASGWAPRAYTGSNPHTDHVHISGAHGSSHSSSATCTGYDTAAEGRTPSFNICGGELSEIASDKIVNFIDPRVDAISRGMDTVPSGPQKGAEVWTTKTLKEILRVQQEILNKLNAPAATGDLAVEGTVTGTLHVQGTP